MVPIRELPYWPAAIVAVSEARQMAASDYAPNTPNIACVTRGVHRRKGPRSSYDINYECGQ